MCQSQQNVVTNGHEFGDGRNVAGTNDLRDGCGTVSKVSARVLSRPPGSIVIQGLGLTDPGIRRIRWAADRGAASEGPGRFGLIQFNPATRRRSVFTCSRI